MAPREKQTWGLGVHPNSEVRGCGGLDSLTA